MDKKEREQRKAEKARRVPINEVTLVVQKGSIDINDIFKRIERKLGGQNG